MEAKIKVRSGYSFRAAVGMVDDVMKAVKAAGYEAAPISDRASTFAFTRWRKAAAKAELRPIFGVELAVTNSLTDKKRSKDYWTFWATDDLKAINDLVELATNQFHFEPLLSYEQAMAATGVIKLAGSKPMLELMKSSDNLFVAMQPSMSRGLFRKAKEAGYRFIASSDNSYPTPDKKAMYEVLVGRGASSQTYPQHILTDVEWHQALPWVPLDDRLEALANRFDVMALCRAEMKQGSLLTPAKPLTLRQMCLNGAKDLKCDLSDPVYAARLEKELRLIDEKKFEDYFFIIADLVQWARKEMVCGPARGSSCGSLVCYLLKITTIDPIPYGLIFERFIDTTRSDLPDIDLDFSDRRRHLVFEYMEQKYGKDRVARLGTVALYQPRSAIAEAGGALDIPRWRTDKVLDSLFERSSGDSRALQVMEDTFNDTEAGRNLIEEFPELRITQFMEGHPRHSSQHAAGIVLTQEPISNYVAIDSRTNSIQCDKKDAEELNLLKIDALGLTQLSVFEDTMEMAKLPFDTLDKIPLDDPEAFDIINKGKYSGIFQYNGVALQSISNQIKTETLEDIIATTALARPGPMASGGTNEWVRRKRGLSPIQYPHPSFVQYLQQTSGIIVYQEQVMDICRNIGGLSWGDVNALRRAMSKSLGVEFFDQYGNRFKENAKAFGIPAEALPKIWDELCSYGSMGFNKAHAVAYGLVSYWCCWFKAHHPFEFAAATLQHENDPSKQIQLLREMAREGIGYVPVDKNTSTDKWQPAYIDNKKVLVGPVQMVNGIGPKLVKAITEARALGKDLPERADKLLTNPVTKIDSLYPIRDAVQKCAPDLKELNIVTSPTEILDVQTNGEWREFLIVGVMKQIKPKDENELVNVAKRGFKLNGPTQALNLWVMDDTDTVFCKVGRFDYQRLGKQIVDFGKPGKALWAIKGTCPPDFRMLKVSNVRFLGEIEERVNPSSKGGQTKKLNAGDQQVGE